MGMKVKLPQVSEETIEKVDKEINLLGVIFIVVIIAFVGRCVLFQKNRHGSNVLGTMYKASKTYYHNGKECYWK